MGHILIAAHGFPPTHSAGAERRAERMAQWLAADGHEVSVFAVEKVDEPGFRVETRQQDAFTIHRLYYDVKDGNHFQNLYDYPPIGNAFREILSSTAFDLVHVVSGYLLGGQVILTAKTMGIPVMVTLTEYWFMCSRLNLLTARGAVCTGPESDNKCMRCLMEDQRRYRLPSEVAPRLMDFAWNIAQRTPVVTPMLKPVSERRVKLRAALDAAHLVICPSQFLIDKFAEFGFNTQNFRFMRQGLKKPVNQPSAESGQSDGMLRLGYLGQIKYHKGVDLLIDSVIELLNQGYKISLDLWGSETEDQKYTDTLKQRSAPYPSIRWNGRYLGADVWKVLTSFDVLVIPSRWYENSPNVILEAYEMQIPIVGTNLGGVKELIEHDRNGLLFRLNDRLDLQHQIERLLREPSLLNQLKQNIPPVKSIDDEMLELVQYYQPFIGT